MTCYVCSSKMTYIRKTQYTKTVTFVWESQVCQHIDNYDIPFYCFDIN